MATFDTLFSEGALPSLMTEFGETVLVRVGSETPREVTAIVNRNPLVDGFAAVQTAKMTVRLYDNYLTGVASDTFDSGNNSIDVADKSGGPLVKRRMARFTSDNGGTLTVEVV